MSIADYRDLVIVIFGVILIIISTSFLVLLFIAFWKMRSFYREASEFMAKLKTVSDDALTQVIEPLIGLAVLINGVRDGLSKFRKIFSPKGGENVR